MSIWGNAVSSWTAVNSHSEHCSCSVWSGTLISPKWYPEWLSLNENPNLTSTFCERGVKCSRLIFSFAKFSKCCSVCASMKAAFKGGTPICTFTVSSNICSTYYWSAVSGALLWRGSNWMNYKSLEQEGSAWFESCSMWLLLISTKLILSKNCSACGYSRWQSSFTSGSYVWIVAGGVTQGIYWIGIMRSEVCLSSKLSVCCNYSFGSLAARLSVFGVGACKYWKGLLSSIKSWLMMLSCVSSSVNL